MTSGGIPKRYDLAAVDQCAEELESTSSICPHCFKLIPARVVSDGFKVYLEKSCPEHGSFRALVWSDLVRYLRYSRFSRPPTPYARSVMKVEKGCPFDCGLCPEHKQHTCLAILEVTENCNLKCPTCLSSSEKEGLYSLNLEHIKKALYSLLDNEGRPTPLQLSGGEPTIRSDLSEVIALARGLGFRFIEVNTNGINLAIKPGLAKEYADAGLEGIYLQFDGLTDEVYRHLRGVDLVKIKEKAIENAMKAGLNVVLAATVVKGINDNQLWGIIQYALRRRLVGVNFQPYAIFGRYPESQLDQLNRITNSDVTQLIESQSGGVLKADDFTPIPCPDYRCQMLCLLSVNERTATPTNRLIETEELLDYYKSFTDPDQMQGAVRDLKKTLQDKCGSCSTVSGTIRESCCCTPFPQTGGHLFSISTHAMMDVWNTDIHRLKSCCIHELTPDGRLIPFCLYNYTSINGQALYRNNVTPQNVRVS